MKKILTFFLCAIFNMTTYSQNLIQNGGFEQCNVLGGCPTDDNNGCNPTPPFPNVQGHFFEVSNWGSNGGFSNSNECSKPDIWSSTNTTANPLSMPSNYGKYVGLYPSENIYYDFGSTQKSAFYKFSIDYALPPSDNSGKSFEIWSTLDVPQDYDCDNSIYTYGANQVLSLSISQSALKKNWYTQSGYVNFNEQFRYIFIKPKKNDNCNEYLFFDNVSLESYCCAEFMKYQNLRGCSTCVRIPKVTQRLKYIMAGNNVGCPNTIPGDVVVVGNQNVLFQAGTVILKPGFRVESGAVFNVRVGGCEQIQPYDTNNFNIKIIGVNNTAYFDCSGDANHSMSFISQGATHYRVRVFNNIGEKVYDHSDMINENVTTCWDGTGASHVAPEHPHAVQLELFNCFKSIIKTYSFVPFYINGCHQWFKKEIETPISDTSSVEIIQVFPNPTNETLNVNITPVGITSIDIRLYDMLGNEVHLDGNFGSNAIFSEQTNFHFQTSNINSGCYTIKVNLNKTSYSKKVIITH